VSDTNSSHFNLRLYYEIETRAKFVMLAYGYTIPTANNANSVNMRSNGLRDTLLKAKSMQKSTGPLITIAN